jgi:ketosteroid isomerase-like protein
MAVTAREVVDQMLQAGRAMDTDACVALMAPDGYIEWPFRPEGLPERVQGREEIRRFLAAAARVPIRFDQYRDLVVHETTDPEVIIVEYKAIGTVTTTGAPFRQTIIAVFRVHNGRIVSYRDYLNPLVLAEARVGLPAG